MSTLSQFFNTDSDKGFSGFFMEEGSPEAGANAVMPYFNYSGMSISGDGIFTSANNSQVPLPGPNTASTTVDMINMGVVGALGTASLYITASCPFNYDYVQRFRKLFVFTSGTGFLFNNCTAGRLRLQTVDDLTLMCRTGMTFTAFTNQTSFANINKFKFAKGRNQDNCNIDISGCALTAQSVENILVGVAAGTPTSKIGGIWTVNLSGGTSSGLSALSAAASAARSTLISIGWTVTLNP